MAKTRQAALIWSKEDQQYLWRDEHDTETLDVRQEPQAWQRRLAAYTSFSFQVREGHLSLLKEARPHGGDGTGMPIDARENARPKSTPVVRLIYPLLVWNRWPERSGVHRSRYTRTWPTEMPAEQAMEPSGQQQ